MWNHGGGARLARFCSLTIVALLNLAGDLTLQGCWTMGVALDYNGSGDKSRVHSEGLTSGQRRSLS